MNALASEKLSKRTDSALAYLVCSPIDVFARHRVDRLLRLFAGRNSTRTAEIIHRRGPHLLFGQRVVALVVYVGGVAEHFHSYSKIILDNAAGCRLGTPAARTSS